MNAKSRKLIDVLRTQLDEIKGAFEEIQANEDQKLSNVPDALQLGYAAEAMQTAISAIGETVEYLDSAMLALDEIQ